MYPPNFMSSYVEFYPHIIFVDFFLVLRRKRNIFLSIINRPTVVMERLSIYLETAKKLLNIRYTRPIFQEKLISRILKRSSTWMEILQELNRPVFSLNNNIHEHKINWAGSG
jgi:hypothetical protein